MPIPPEKLDSATARVALLPGLPVLPTMMPRPLPSIVPELVMPPAKVEALLTTTTAPLSVTDMPPVLVMPPENVLKPAATIAKLSTTIVPLLVMPPEKVETLTAERPLDPCRIVPLLLILPEKTETELTEMAMPVAVSDVSVPVLTMLPANVGTLYTRMA